MSRDIGIDLGTANVLIHLKGRGIILNEPAVIAVDTRTQEVIAVGDDAYPLLGRTSDSIEVTYPLKGGVITDYALAEALLTIFVSKVYQARWWKRPNVLICAPSGITEIEQLSLLEAVENVVPGQIFLMEETLVGAVGAGIDIDSSKASMIIDIGGGTTEISVISRGDIVSTSSLQLAGNDLDIGIQDFLRENYRLEIGLRTAETIKIKLASACVVPKDDLEYYPVRGKNLSTGLPKSINIHNNHIQRVVEKQVTKIAHATQTLLEDLETAMMTDILSSGIVLTGGGALIKGIDRYLSEKLKVNVIKADEPMNCVALGSGIVLESIRNKSYNKAKITKRSKSLSEKFKDFWHK